MLILLFCLFSCIQFVGAVATNRTIDDTAGDLVTGVKPVYLPYPWQGPSCIGCAIQPPLDEVFMGTYSALTFMPEKFSLQSIQFSFHGTAVYVFFILVNFVAEELTTETLCNFTLDGNTPETFHHVPSPTPGYLFNSLVYSRENLPNTNHTLLISTSGLDHHVFTSFDYARYTFDDTNDVPPSPTIVRETSATTVTLTTSGSTSSGSRQAGPNSTRTSPTSFSSSSLTSTGTTSQSLPTSPAASGQSRGLKVEVIVGGVVGGLIVLLAFLLAFVCHRRRNNVAPSANARGSDPTYTPLGVDGGLHAVPTQRPMTKPRAPLPSPQDTPVAAQPPSYASLYPSGQSCLVPNGVWLPDARIDAAEADVREVRHTSRGTLGRWTMFVGSPRRSHCA